MARAAWSYCECRCAVPVVSSVLLLSSVVFPAADAAGGAISTRSSSWNPESASDRWELDVEGRDVALAAWCRNACAIALWLSSRSLGPPTEYTWREGGGRWGLRG